MSIEKIRNSKSKTLAIVTAIFLMISIVTPLTLVPTTSAHTPAYQIPTHAYIEVNPNPIGVGQKATIFIWVDQVFGVGFEANASAALTNNYRFHNYNLTIVKPDGSVSTTIFGTITDPTSNQITSITPDQVGTYNFYFSFPGQNYTQYAGGYEPTSQLVNDTYLPSSATATLTVQQEAIPLPINSYPLPTEYWARPIYGENTDWWSISSNWLGTGSPVISATGSGDITAFSTGPPSFSWGSVMQRYPGDAIGPQTGHIMWTKPLQFGGVVGGNQFTSGGSYPGNGQGVGWFEGSAYSQRYTNPIIMNGVLYYTEPVSFLGTTTGPTDAVDLRTGQVLWSRLDVPALSFGYIYNLWSPNQHGVYPGILFTSNFARAFDAATGDPLFNVSLAGTPTVSGAYEALGPQGEHLRFVYQNLGNATNPNWNLLEWNSSRLWETIANPWTGAAINSPTLFNMSTVVSGGVAQSPTIPNTPTVPAATYIVNGNIPLNSTTAGIISSYDWNVSMSSVKTSAAPTILAAFQGDMLLCLNGTQPNSPGSFTGAPHSSPYTYFAININASKGSIGQILWSNTIQPPAGNITVYYAGADPVTKVFVESYKESLNWVGYSLTTGQQIWGPTVAQTDFDYYGQPGPNQLGAQLAYGKLYTSGYAGILYAFDLTNGNLLWTYGNGGPGNSTKGGLAVFYGDYPTFINAVGNGVIYLLTTEHTITDPIYKGALARAVNATDGTEIWTLSDYTGEFVSQSYAIADGFATFLNGYDNQIYSVGRGSSATTVTAPDAGLAFGQPVVIRGTVTDTSAGTKQPEQIARFPTGVPVASDASMKDWMGYVYQQKPLPTNFTGVPVTIDVLDSNGNYRNIGTATTTASGTYSLSWTPDIPGSYTVIATFHGTNGYWPTYAQTSFDVMQQAATPAPTSAPIANVATTSDLLTYMAAGVIAIIIAIAIVGLLLYRKHP